MGINVTTVRERRERAYALWKAGATVTEAFKETGASRTTLTKWFTEWATEFASEVEAEIGSKKVRDGIESIHLRHLGNIYEKTLYRTEYIERQKKVSDSFVGMVGSALVDIQKEVQKGARYLDFHKELASLVKTLETAQRVFNLAAGLATTHLAVDMGLVEKALSGVPDDALEVWAEMDDGQPIPSSDFIK
jgi:hypothetical protein